MKSSRIAGLCALTFAQSALAADLTDTAQVVSVTPIFERVADTRQECYTEPTGAAAPANRERSVAAPILGGVAGAVLGSQIGRGSGRDVATAVGAVVGTVAGDRVANPNSDGSIAGAAVGGAAGAILGNQVGRGSGRTAATGAGAVAGAVVGDRVATGGAQPAQGQPVQRCRTVDAGGRDVVRGYNVVYRYNGRDIATTMPYDPGNSVRVTVSAVDSVAPARPTALNDGYERDYATPTRTRQPRAPEGGYTYRY
jgi:uncharacterized protein YcfJ